MFIGHFAVGLAAKSSKPSISLGTYFLAAQFVDLLWPTLLLVGWESVAIEPGITVFTPLNFLHYPISHSLLMAFVWAAIGFALVFAFRKDAVAAMVVAACVASHWVLDFVTHRPDLPLLLNETTKVGLGLWNHKVATIVVESALFVGAIWLYTSKMKSIDRIGMWGFWSLIAFLGIIHVMNMVGPPPPGVEAIAWAGQLQWLFVLWAYWVDKHREVK